MMLVLGLGNPGAIYSKSRHNVGFWCVERTAREHGTRLDKRNRHAVFGEGTIAEEDVVLAKPRTYVNRSGAAARYLLERYRLAPSALFVVHDDMDLPLGHLRIRARGGSSGHKGVSSIISELGTEEFPRLRIGIGHPDAGDTVPFVLGTFTSEESEAIREVIEVAAEAIAWVVQHGVESAMNKFNRRVSQTDA